ncbi:hypothetical protein [uncultured Pontibacter sp.]|uniref:hypothetical protein n=1 Tax=uncultured Pontibacter sp. TaxID=453356 RepID=UPI00260E6BDC|nr:hypothetical protein [uncultured Pontibacter sp.]
MISYGWLLAGIAKSPEHKPDDMNKSTLNFWILFTVSIILSALIISIFIKVLKVALFVILVLVLAPIIYIVLKLLLPGARGKSEDDKLKSRP